MGGQADAETLIPQRLPVYAKRGNADFASLDEDDQQHYALLIHNLFSALEAIYIQSQSRLTIKGFADRV